MDWKPAIYKGSTLYELPRPVKSLVPKDTWDMRDAKVPLADRSFVYGASKNGVEIAVSGLIAAAFDEDGELSALCTERNRFAEYEAFRAALDVSDDSERFEFFVYHNPDADGGPPVPYYRKYKSCVCKEMTVDIGDDARVDWPYTLTIFATDPVIYQTAPGM